MLKQAEEVIDLALLVLVMVTVVLYAMPVLYQMDRMVTNAELNILKDKNTGKANGYYVNEYGDFDDSYSKVAAVLVTQVQDANMPTPRTIHAEGMELKLPLSRKDYAYECGQTAWLLLSGHDADSRYKVTYRYQLNDKGRIVNDYYNIERMVE